MDYETLRKKLLEFIAPLPYVPTYQREKLTDQIIDIIKDHAEPNVPRQEEVS